MQSEQLPASLSVPISNLSAVFNNVTNSYKFLFFFALMDALVRNDFNPDADVSLDELLVDMLVHAWYPHIYFKLSFGAQDKIARELDRFPLAKLEQTTGKFNPTDLKRVRSLLGQAKLDCSKLVRFVPYRLIRPFFPELAGLKDQQVNGRVAEMSASYFVARKPLYRFVENGTGIRVHPDWLTYLKTNLPIVNGWARWHYLLYMQRENPFVPNVAAKLFAPTERESLAAQRKFWTAVLEREPLPCIYSGERLNPADICLDHFLPWSFVVHNEYWNLIPVTTSANSSKSDQLPDWSYLTEFVRVQHAALNIGKSHKKWPDVAREYSARLQLSDEAALLDSNALQSSYERLYRPQFELAKINGFQSNWRFRSNVNQSSKL